MVFSQWTQMLLLCSLLTGHQDCGGEEGYQVSWGFTAGISREKISRLTLQCSSWLPEKSLPELFLQPCYRVPSQQT